MTETDLRNRRTRERNAVSAPQRCPLCGYRFDKPVAVCNACPLHESCGAEACPHCGYQFVTQSAVVGLIRRIAGRIRRD